MTQTFVVLAGGAVVALLAGTWAATQFGGSDDPYAQCRDSAVAGGVASIGGPFTLVNGAGETVTEADVFTRPSLLYFGYTFCPDVCPADAARNAEATDLLIEQGIDAQPVFITVDPERDTPEVVGEWAGYLHERMIGLTGTAEQVEAAGLAYRTFSRKQEGDPEYYLMDHSTFTYLVLPEEGFVEFFRNDESAEEVARRSACFVEAA